MDQHEMDSLIQKVLEGSASPEETAIVDNWYRQINDEAIEIPLASDHEIRLTGQRVLNNIHRQIDRTAPVVRPLLRKRMMRTAAAAVVIAVIGVAGFFALGRRSHAGLADAGVNKVSSDAAPAIKKATLTLSTGKVIELNDRPQGLIVEDGNASVEKQANGRLIYHSLGEKKSEQVFNTMRTPRGGQYQLLLPDGTQVWLNAASSITYPTMFSNNERNVEITGEAYFEVTHDALRPFHVKVNEVSVEVLGTSFNINAYAKQSSIRTTLLEGKVNVFQGKVMATLLPGQEANAGGKNISVKNNPNAEDVLAWKNGLFNFENADLDEVLNEVSRWYDVDVVFEGERPAMHYGGKISRNLYASQMLTILEKSGVHFRIEGKKLIITK